MIEYTYTASGRKLSQQLVEDGRIGKNSRYAGQFVLNGDALAWVNIPHGRIFLEKMAISTLEFHLKDHLGNTSIALTTNEGSDYTVTQDVSYYPFGMTIADLSHFGGIMGGSTANRYLYNGKELQSDFGLDWYDYGVRFYDAEIGRWHVIDPLAEHAYSWTPYRYGFNNPIRFIDPDGRIEWPLSGTTAINVNDRKDRGWGLKNTVVRTSPYLCTDRPEGASNPHIGIDYRAAENTTFYSLGDGTVIEIGETPKGGNFITVEYEGGDKVTFRHINETSSELEVGSSVLEGQPLGKTGNTGTGSKAAHLHVDAIDIEGTQINPENKNYGNVTNEKFFNEFGGDYLKLKQAKDEAIKKLNEAGRID
ncbi:MAG: peptidoglycan DD-metalloendopeptidase family protein [Bacteroidetes bacterium]|nr:peptidoglycan DD-metalloendopeptidase family protein [Bacteroidota bacterium]